MTAARSSHKLQITDPATVAQGQTPAPGSCLQELFCLGIRPATTPARICRNTCTGLIKTPSRNFSRQESAVADHCRSKAGPTQLRRLNCACGWHHLATNFAGMPLAAKWHPGCRPPEPPSTDSPSDRAQNDRLYARDAINIEDDARADRAARGWGHKGFLRRRGSPFKMLLADPQAQYPSHPAQKRSRTPGGFGQRRRKGLQYRDNPVLLPGLSQGYGASGRVRLWPPWLGHPSRRRPVAPPAKAAEAAAARADGTQAADVVDGPPFRGPSPQTCPRLPG
jgi:hypothetical protein